MTSKLSKTVIILFGLILLASCKPSDKYAGDWYALSDTGENVMLHFSEEKILTITDESGNEETFEINQNVAGVMNSTRYYRVEVDGANHYVIFEDKDDESNANFVKQTNYADDFEDMAGEIIYTMNRDDYPREFGL
ncbi:hypothetical protein MKY30_23415 [Oceanobacillus sp. FSL W8-0428]|uniref:Lipocalin-like domain-containing protein n=1 Tax=Oceanobacillus sojae TaxID=582851 RepID=A0A511ZMV0_9BACI|nr:hypothetical protein [Oceanobacillus sojae]GEN88785.1 hypothetical protein OSO01_35240 [Oceanobacillus sojae]